MGGEASLSVFLERASDTEALGACLARCLVSGDVVLLFGELGAGKTTLVKGVLAGLSADQEATSPTFALCHLYDSDPPVAHVDCWRLSSPDELEDLALDELLEQGMVAVIEWGELARARYALDALEVVLEPARAGRVATVSGKGSMGPRIGVLCAGLHEVGLHPCEQASR